MLFKTMLIAGAAMLASVTLASAQDAANYPDHQVRVVVGSSPGGTADTVSRLISEHLTEKFGETFFVDNMPGSGGALASTFLSKAEKDGYTIQFAFISSHAILPNLNKNLEYDPIADFFPISLVSYSPNVLLVDPEFGVSNIEELVAKLKADPGKYDYGSSSVGGSQHLSMELFLQDSGTEAVHIPYKGSGELIAALLGGQIPFAFDTMTSSVPHIEAGSLLGIGVTSPERISALPDLPTISETIPDYQVIAWNGFLAPAGTDPEIVQKLSDAIAEFMSEPEQVEFFTKLGTTAVGSGPDEFADLIKSDLAKFGQVIESAGISLQ